MFLAFALIIQYGLKGIQEKSILPKPYNHDAAKLTENKRDELNIR
jgi:glutamine synthetase